MDIEKYFEEVPTGLQSTCRKLLLIARTQMPEAHEIIYHGAICFSTSPSKFYPFAYIAPKRSWVNLGFFFGAGLPDPKKLLVGEGKRMRHIKIRNEIEADNPSIKRILKAALKQAHDDMAKGYLRYKREKK